MRNLIIYTTLLLFSIALTHSGFAFVFWELNPANLHAGTRMLEVVAAIALFVFSGMIYNETKKS